MGRGSRRWRYRAAAVGAVGSLVALAHADTIVSTSANILGAFSLAKNADLKFGQMTPPSTGDEWVRVRPDGSLDCPSTMFCTGNAQAANFTVTGANAFLYAVTVPQDAVLTSGDNEMPIADFRTDRFFNIGFLSGGVSQFSVGASIKVAPDQPAGTYQGTFNVTVDYY